MTLKALYSASTGMHAQETRINNIAHNLSNINTTGYKNSRASFEDLIYETVEAPGLSTSDSTSAPVGVQIGHGTRINGVYKHFTQGELNQSNRQLDVAIEGSGFFQITLPDGTTGYTRNGALQVDSSGNLVNEKGYAVSPTITIPAEAVSINIASDGVVSVSLAGESSVSELGTIQLATFRNDSGLNALGENLYQETDASGTATVVSPGASGSGTLVQGFLENSNVNIAEELINMIIAQRTYEANSKVLQTSSEMMRQASSVV